MKKISRFATLFVLAASFASPLSAFAACPAPFVEDNGQCYSVANNVFTLQPGVSPTAGIPAGNVPSSNVGNLSSSGGGVNLTIAQGYSTGIINFINSILVPVLMAIAFIVFLWGVYKYFILGAADETSRKDGRQFVLWGIIGFVIILSMWALVTIVAQTFGLQLGGGSPTPPTFTAPR